MKTRTLVKYWPYFAIAILGVVTGLALMQAAQQRATLQWIWDQGGDYQTRPSTMVRLTPPPAQRWLRARWGHRWSDPIASVVVVACPETEITKAELARLVRFRDLEKLYLNHTGLDDAMLEHVAELSELRVLGLGETEVGDEGLKHLRRLRKLERLHLYRTKVSDAGLVHLRDSGELWELILEDTRVTDAGIPELQPLPKLTALNLGGTNVSDAGMISLKALSHLEVLVIENTQVTDKGMIHLEELANLRKLVLGGTRVSNAERDWLKKALPRLEIVPPSNPYYEWPEALPKLSPIGGI